MGTDRKNIPEEAVRGLLEQARLTGEEVASHLTRALSPTHWEELNPRLSVGGGDGQRLVETTVLDLPRRLELRKKVAQEGYLQIEPLLVPSSIELLWEGVEVLIREDWPPVFAFVYDQFWQVVRLPSLLRLLADILGPEFQQTADMWTYHVPPCAGAAGWPPHTDYPGRSNRLTIWVPLTCVTAETGCICVIPKNLAPQGIAEKFYQLETLAKADVMTLLQSSRALPAQAGSVLAWESGVLHWGSVRGRAGGPRLSVAVSFIGSGTEPTPRELPLLDAHSPPPTFAQRLYLIGAAILDNQRNELRLLRYLELARRLVEAQTGNGP